MPNERWADLKLRTKEFALRILRLARALPKTLEGQRIADQLLRAGMGVGANFREATRARSGHEFAAKVNIALMELEEVSYWFELLQDGEIITPDRLVSLRAEAEELIAIFVTIIKNAKEE
ncbi:MAG TPA: four helix bundle protein [Pirellulales bacterium]|jgi:four helix bundle protein|nr:four helix bundle protein [Pirellulales bacterium]